MRIYAVSIAMSVFVVLLPNAWATKSKSPGLAMDCEFLLVTPKDAASAQKWMFNALSAVESLSTVPVYTGYSPLPAAFRALGLPEKYPRHTAMEIEFPGIPSGVYWIRIFADTGQVLASFPFHVPPLVVWKHVQGWGSNTTVELSKDIQRENPHFISVGVPLGDFANGRKFLVVRRRLENLVTVAIGIDVPMNDYQTYTHAGDPALVNTDDGQVLSRVEVIKAHFRVPWSSSQRNLLSDPRRAN